MGQNSTAADLERILEAVDQLSGDRQVSLAWLRTPLKEFQGLTPEELVGSGRTVDLLAYVDSVSGGFVG